MSQIKGQWRNKWEMWWNLWSKVGDPNWVNKKKTQTISKMYKFFTCWPLKSFIKKLSNIYNQLVLHTAYIFIITIIIGSTLSRHCHCLFFVFHIVASQPINSSCASSACVSFSHHPHSRLPGCVTCWLALYSQMMTFDSCLHLCN